MDNNKKGNQNNATDKKSDRTEFADELNMDNKNNKSHGNNSR